MYTPGSPSCSSTDTEPPSGPSSSARSADASWSGHTFPSASRTTALARHGSPTSGCSRPWPLSTTFSARGAFGSTSKAPLKKVWCVSCSPSAVTNIVKAPVCFGVKEAM